MTSSKLCPLPEPAGFSSGTHDGALFTLKRSTGKNFAKGALQPLCEWYTADQMRAYAAAAVAAERERWKTMMRRAIATCFEQRAHHEVMSDPQHFAAEALKA